MSSFSTIYQQLPVVTLTPLGTGTTNFWISPKFYNTGIETIICYFSNSCNNGVGASALKVFIVEEVAANSGGGATFSNRVIAEAHLNTPYNGGLLSGNRSTVIFNKLAAANNAPVQNASPLGVALTITDPNGIPVTIASPATAGAVSASAYFPEYFRILYQNLGAIDGSVANNLIRVVK